MSKYFNWIGILLLAACLGIACNARVDGCLDLEADNFDVTADNADPSLCIYPDLLLDVVYRYGDTTFSRQRLYENAFGQTFGLPDVYVLFSQFAVTGVEYPRLTVADRTDWYLGSGPEPEEIRVIDDFTFVDQRNFRFTLGEWRQSDYALSVDFSVGVPDTLVPTDPALIPDDNGMSDSRAFYNEAVQTFSSARFVYVLDSLEAQPDTVHLTPGAFHFTYPLEKELIRGGDDTIRVGIDFKVLFDDVDLMQDSATVVNQLANRLQSAIFDNN